MRRTLSYLFFLMCLPAFVAAGDYFRLNKTSGTANVPFTFNDDVTIGAIRVRPSSSTLSTEIAAAPDGAVLLLSPGDYYTDDDIVINKPLTIKGYGRGRSLIHRATMGESECVIKITSSNVHIEGIGIVGPNAAAYVSEEKGIYFLGESTSSRLTNVGVENVEVYGIGSYGVLFENASNFYVRESIIHDVGHIGIGTFSSELGSISKNDVYDITPGDTIPNAYNVVLTVRTSTHTRSNNITVENNLLHDNTIWECADTHGGHDITFTGNVLTNCRLGINLARVSASPYLPPYNISVTGNTLKSGTVTNTYRGIGGGGYNATYISSGIAVTGNFLDGYGYDGAEEGAIMFKYTKGLTLTGNTITNSKNSAICLQAGNLDFVASGNTISEIVSTQTAAGISLPYGSQTGEISGNNINATAEYGIYLGAANRGVNFGRNRIKTSGTGFSGGAYAGLGLELRGSVTYDPPSIADGDQDYFDITVTGAEVGDSVDVSTSRALIVGISGGVRAADTVRVILQNNSGSARDLDSSTFYAVVTKNRAE